MIIRKIKKYPKKTLSTVYIDDNVYEIENLIIAKYNLYEELEIDEKLFRLIIDESDKERGYNLAIKYLAKYVKSSEEVTKYLKGKKIKQKNIKEVIKRLKDNHILNDDKTIDAIIFSLIIGKNGKNLIRYKLFQKGFSEELIKEKLDDIDEELYYDTLLEFYQKTKKKYDKYDEYTKKNKIKQYLISRGYTISDLEHLDI